MYINNCSFSPYPRGSEALTETACGPPNVLGEFPSPLRPCGFSQPTHLHLDPQATLAA